MRDQRLIELRPEIPTIHISSQISEGELFQNQTLRPILKFQNEIILDLFKAYIHKRKNTFHTLDEKQRLDYIDQHMKKDKELAAEFCGMVLGLCTKEEFITYRLFKSEINKRIRTLIIQRLQSQLSALVNQ